MSKRLGGMMSLVLAAGALGSPTTLLVPDYSTETSKDRRKRKEKTKERKKKKKARQQRKKSRGF